MCQATKVHKKFFFSVMFIKYLLCQTVYTLREPIISNPKPERPFQEVAGDFCLYVAHDFQILVDCF